MTRVQTAHSSGKWSSTDAPAFDRNVRRMRQGHSLVSRTEATAAQFDHEIHWPSDGWGHWHPTGSLGRDCAVEWDQDVWEKLDHGVLQLTKHRITTESGHLQPPVCLTWALLRHRRADIELEFGAAHLDLDNTELRRRANLDECWSLRQHYGASKRQHKRRRHLLQMDGNRNQRELKWRAYFARELFAGTGMRTGWRAPYPAQGTHGRALLDLSAADFPIRSRIMADDTSSDHRPYETEGTL